MRISRKIYLIGYKQNYIFKIAPERVQLKTNLLPVNLVMPQDQEEFALSLNGKKRNIRKKDFLAFADGCGISKASAEKMMGKLVSMEEKYLTMCAESYLPEEMKDRFSRLIRERCSRLFR